MVNVKGLQNPWAIIGILVAILVLTAVVSATFGSIITQFTSLNSLGNFTFSSLFADDGVGEIILSAIVLIGILAVLGVKISQGMKR